MIYRSNGSTGNNKLDSRMSKRNYRRMSDMRGERRGNTKNRRQQEEDLGSKGDEQSSKWSKSKSSQINYTC